MNRHCHTRNRAFTARGQVKSPSCVDIYFSVDGNPSLVRSRDVIRPHRLQYRTCGPSQLRTGKKNTWWEVAQLDEEAQSGQGATLVWIFRLMWLLLIPPTKNMVNVCLSLLLWLVCCVSNNHPMAMDEGNVSLRLRYWGKY